MKRGVIIIALLVLGVLLVLGFSFIKAATIFPASNVSIKIDGTDRTLQYSVDNSLLIGTHTYASSNYMNIVGQHDASQVWVSVKDGETTLLNALNSSSFPTKLCPNPSKPLTYSNPAPNPGHYAIEIILYNGKSLQQAINDGDYCTSSWYIGSWVSNNACPTTTFTRTVYCQSSQGNNLGTACGIYQGCDCPTPSSSTTTSCYWMYISQQSGCYHGGCSGSYSCSPPTNPCSPANAAYDYLDQGSECDCIWTGGCEGFNNNHYRCQITNPS